MAHSQPASSASSGLRRECFVTVGATASFRALITNALSPSFLNTLSDLKYTNLTIQCGRDLSYANIKIRDEASQSHRKKGMRIKTFDFNELGLGAEMKNCKEVAGSSKEGIVVCHGGAGTVLDAMRLDIPIVVVPNPELLDNHQAELAEELERQGYATYGHLDELSAALHVSEEKSRARKTWPQQDASADSTGSGIEQVMDEEVGFEISTREVLD